ncbi:hypothetical protein DSO57_1036305 [Entomophthora muscae]|uniref:Uncharacterized protein n=1 Tax=Entomophthora muscae TaxID=34485 RepID=A0ACC2SNQ0_9FUNG|nr:hypothetical protein DSO57_1036305 [Entomophthora muscae]
MKKTVAEKTLTASSNSPSPKIDPDPATKEPPDKEDSLMDLDASPERYLPDKEEVNKNFLHQLLAVNDVTRRQDIHTEALPSHEAIETVSISYAKQLYILLEKVRAILDSGAPGNIVSTRLAKKLKLALDLDYKEKFSTTCLDKIKALGAYSSLLLWLCKLVVTAPDIVLCNNSYNILIGTSFMATYKTIINHKDSTFSILGHLVPMFYHGYGPKDLPTKKIHHINIEYANGDLPIPYAREN